MDIPLIEQVKIQAQVLVPLLRAFQNEIGLEWTNEITNKVLGELQYKIGQEITSQFKGNSIEKTVAAFPLFSAGNGLDYEVLRQTPDTLEVKVTRCNFAQAYKNLDAPDLGLLCMCNPDFDFMKGFTPDIEMTRTQAIMEGASHCRIIYQIKK
ncbi:MAG: L-2-amino-thiazoline-4-carboxylic acid hydrolase [Chloroflexi bacterium]|nr:L-2-amino-thiazoline-4-carboxylic acid hydrolase [Chloroflexota bacterium]